MRSRALFVVGAGLVFLVGLVVGRVTAPEQGSGIQGKVMFGGCIADDCRFVPQPACQFVRKAVDGDYDARADVVARLCSREDGRYRVSVPPGNYYLEPDEREDAPGLLKPSGPVEVQRGGYTSWNLVYDNGMR